MADNVYVVDQLVTGTATITQDDDGSGIDTIDLGGVHDAGSSIDLSWVVLAGVSVSGEGIYFTNGNEGHRLVVNGFIENARGSNGSDFIAGNEGANFLEGDQLDTGPGGNDTIGGDEGNDTIFGGAGNDNIGGAEDDDILFGDAGDDTISGGGGIDLVIGGAGADSLSGGASIGDTVSYLESDDGVTINITSGSTTTGIGGYAAGDSINGFTDVIGSDFDDVITDTLKGFNGSNINAFAGAGGADFLVLGGGADLGLGGDGGDTVRGEEGNDTLSGDANGDYLTGGRGKDRISGGGDADRFIFNLKSDSTTAIGGRDTITDFSHGQGDRIDLRAIDARSGSGNQSFDFIGTDRFSGDKGDLRIVKSGQNLIVQGDIDGDKQADFAILVEDTGILRSGDFFL